MKTKHTFWADKEVLDKAKARAKYEGRPLSLILRLALKAYAKGKLKFERLRDLAEKDE